MILLPDIVPVPMAGEAHLGQKLWQEHTDHLWVLLHSTEEWEASRHIAGA